MAPVAEPTLRRHTPRAAGGRSNAPGRNSAATPRSGRDEHSVRGVLTARWKWRAVFDRSFHGRNAGTKGVESVSEQQSSQPDQHV